MYRNFLEANLHQKWEIIMPSFSKIGVAPVRCHEVYSQEKTKVGIWSFSLAHLKNPFGLNKKYKNTSTLTCTTLELFWVKYIGN